MCNFFDDDFDDEMEFFDDDFTEEDIPSDMEPDSDIFGITEEEFIFGGMILGQAYEEGLDESEQGNRKKKKPE